MSGTTWQRVEGFECSNCRTSEGVEALTTEAGNQFTWLCKPCQPATLPHGYPVPPPVPVELADIISPPERSLKDIIGGNGNGAKIEITFFPED